MTSSSPSNWVKFSQFKPDHTENNELDLASHFDYLRLSFADLNGLHLTKLIPVETAQKLIKKSSEIYSGVITFGPRNEVVHIPAVVQSKHVNGFLKADWSTLHSVPWAGKNLAESIGPKRIGSVLCEIHWPHGPVLEAMPRNVAAKMVQRLRDRHSLLVYSSFEPEFRVFKPESVKEEYLGRPDPVDRSVVPEPFTLGTDMYKTGLLSHYEGFFLTLDHYLKGIGIQVQDYTSENGEAQLEAPLMPTYGLAAADIYFIMKQAVKDVAQQCGLFASFMPKPLANMSSSGCHFNHSIWHEHSKKNAFYDSNEPNNLSKTALAWLGGIMEHGPALLAFCSPSVNCYRRLHKHLAPSLVNWDLQDRFVSIRVKNQDESRTYIENRLPSSAACPYHVLAATLAAGMDGIERNLQPPSPGNKDPSLVAKLPESLPDALEALRKDRALIDILGEEFVDWFIQVKERGDLATIPNAKELMTSPETNEALAAERHEYFQYI